MADAEPEVELTAFLGFDIPDACRPGIAANLKLLQTHAAVLDAYILAEEPLGEGATPA